MTNPLVDGALLVCSYGTVPSRLMVSKAINIATSVGSMATLSDFLSGDSIDHFGTCNVDGTPCKPITPLPWDVAASRLVLGSEYAISIVSELKCMKIEDALIVALTPGDSSIVLETLIETTQEIFESLMEDQLIDAANSLEPLLGGLYWAYFTGQQLTDKDCQREPWLHPAKCKPDMPPSPPEDPPLTGPPPVPIIDWDRAVDVAGSTATGALGGALAGAGIAAVIASPTLVIPGVGEVVEGVSIGTGAVVGGVIGGVGGAIKSIFD